MVFPLKDGAGRNFRPSCYEHYHSLPCKPIRFGNCETAGGVNDLLSTKMS
jgi:hypothetical protein